MHTEARVGPSRSPLSSADNRRQKVAIDLCYDAIMEEKELKSLAKQIKYSYGCVKNANTPYPFELLLIGCSDALREALSKFSANRWSVRWCDSEWSKTVAKSNLVYLSPDSENVLWTLDAEKVYIIGGIVDRSRKKGASLGKAAHDGIVTARLPVQETIVNRLDHILNVNTVLQVLTEFAIHNNWHTALTIALPDRKQRSSGRQSEKRKKWRLRIKNCDASHGQQQISRKWQGVSDIILEDLASLYCA